MNEAAEPLNDTPEYLLSLDLLNSAHFAMEQAKLIQSLRFGFDEDEEQYSKEMLHEQVEILGKVAFHQTQILEKLRLKAGWPEFDFYRAMPPLKLREFNKDQLPSSEA